MVGQSALNRSIGVRIPGGQPNKINNLAWSLSSDEGNGWENGWDWEFEIAGRAIQRWHWANLRAIAQKAVHEPNPLVVTIDPQQGSRSSLILRDRILLMARVLMNFD
jgi:hypothetical protein